MSVSDLEGFARSLALKSWSSVLTIVKISIVFELKVSKLDAIQEMRYSFLFLHLNQVNYNMLIICE